MDIILNLYTLYLDEQEANNYINSNIDCTKEDIDYACKLTREYVKQLMNFTVLHNFKSMNIAENFIITEAQAFLKEEGLIW